MSGSESEAPARLDPFQITFSVLRLVSSIAFGSVAGYTVMAGLIGMIGLMLGVDSIVRFAPEVGWLLGAAGGLASEIPRFRKRDRAKRKPGKYFRASSLGKKGRALKPGANFAVPTLKEFGKSLGLGSLFGLILGVMASVYLSLVLVSVTTSPFVPDSWRPGTSAVSNDPMERERRRLQRNDGASVESNYTHPLLGPIFYTTTGALLAIGFVAGAVTAFFPETEGSHQTN